MGCQRFSSLSLRLLFKGLRLARCVLLSFRREEPVYKGMLCCPFSLCLCSRLLVLLSGCLPHSKACCYLPSFPCTFNSSSFLSISPSIWASPQQTTTTKAVRFTRLLVLPVFNVEDRQYWQLDMAPMSWISLSSYCIARQYTFPK